MKTSGHGVNQRTVVTDGNDQAITPDGECLVGANGKDELSSVHDLMKIIVNKI